MFLVQGFAALIIFFLTPKFHFNAQGSPYLPICLNFPRLSTKQKFGVTPIFPFPVSSCRVQTPKILKHNLGIATTNLANYFLFSSKVPRPMKSSIYKGRGWSR
jgi:hypothetical protein